MPLYSRRCTECNVTEDDRYESINNANIIPCEKCGKLSFTKVYSLPHLPPDGLYSFMAGLDQTRAKAESGHGNHFAQL